MPCRGKYTSLQHTLHQVSFKCAQHAHHCRDQQRPTNAAITCLCDFKAGSVVVLFYKSVYGIRSSETALPLQHSKFHVKQPCCLAASNVSVPFTASLYDILRVKDVHSGYMGRHQSWDHVPSVYIFPSWECHTSCCVSVDEKILKKGRTPNVEFRNNSCFRCVTVFARLPLPTSFLALVDGLPTCTFPFKVKFT
jgi:hypothetical protein